MEYTDVVSNYLTIGAGGICVCLMVWMVIYQTKTINPKLSKLESNNEVTNEILRSTNDMITKSMDVISKNQDVIASSQKAIENNTEAMKNFSGVLQEFAGSINVQNDKLRDIADCTQQTSRDVLVLGERVK